MAGLARDTCPNPQGALWQSRLVGPSTQGMRRPESRTQGQCLPAPPKTAELPQCPSPQSPSPQPIGISCPCPLRSPLCGPGHKPELPSHTGSGGVTPGPHLAICRLHAGQAAAASAPGVRSFHLSTEDWAGRPAAHTVLQACSLPHPSQAALGPPTCRRPQRSHGSGAEQEFRARVGLITAGG